MGGGGEGGGGEGGGGEGGGGEGFGTSKEHAKPGSLGFSYWSGFGLF